MLKLQTYPLVGFRWAVYITLSLVAAITTFYARLDWTIPIHIWLFLLLLTACGIFIGLVTRHVSIDVDSKTLNVDYQLNRLILRRSSIDLSRIEWIRARMTFDDVRTNKMSTIIEGSTRGYETVLILKKPLDSYQRRAESSILADEIASALGVESKGYKDLT